MPCTLHAALFPATHDRGKIILLIDSAMTAPLATELLQLESDLVGDGWTVVRREVSRHESPHEVRRVVQEAYHLDPRQTKMLFIVGHVPVAESGQSFPDGHFNRARPAATDAFYADIYGVWTMQENVIRSVELAVGRVDFWNMPEFSQSETELLRQYLKKAHAYRHKKTTTVDRGFHGNRFPDITGAVPRNQLNGLFGPENVIDCAAPCTLSDRARSESFRFAFEGGYGTRVGIKTEDYLSGDPRVDFLWLYGSYTWDWRMNEETSNGASIHLRAPLAGVNHGLISIWGPGSWWTFDSLSRGGTWGDVWRESIQRLRPLWMHLSGDPTLRLHPLAPPRDLQVEYDATPQKTRLLWQPSADPVDGYFVYQSAREAGLYTLYSSELIRETGLDLGEVAGPQSFMVRAAKQKMTPAGEYTNLSQGVFVTLPERRTEEREYIPPIVTLSPDQTVEFPASVSLSASIKMDPTLQSQVPRYLWAKRSGPGEVHWQDDTSPQTTADFEMSGDYSLSFTVDDGFNRVSKLTRITVLPHTSPKVSANSDVQVTLPAAAFLEGLIEGPQSIHSMQWSFVEGPETVTFEDHSARKTRVQFVLPGQYKFRFQVWDGRPDERFVRSWMSDATTEVTVLAQENAAPVPTDLAQMIVFPVPWVASRDAGIKFMRLPHEGRIFIYSTGGEVVKEIEFAAGHPDPVDWDVRREPSIGPDVYLYRVISGVHKKSGKLVIVK